MSQLFEIVRLGHPALRREAEVVSQDLISSGEIAEIAARMIRTMHEASGVGLAAPQVGLGLRMFVYWVPGPEGDPEIADRVLVNPQIKQIGDGIEDGWEGCLSIPEMRGLVPRYDRVKVRAFDEIGQPVSFTADGFHARVIQHELDHLDGIVFLDRMPEMESLAYDPELDRFGFPPLFEDEARELGDEDDDLED